MAQQAQGPAYGIDSSIPDFNSETYRLMRDDWQGLGITAFSQEVWALMQLLQDYNTTGTQTYQQQPDSTPITIQQPFTIPNAPGITIEKLGPGGVPVQSLTIGPYGFSFNNGPPNPAQTPSQGGTTAGGGATALQGVVVSGGPGSQYQVMVTNPDGSTSTVSVTQLQIDPTATIQPGTACVVFQGSANSGGATGSGGLGSGSGIGGTNTGTNYFMLVPVWQPAPPAPSM